ncbi:hypothetical protein INR49_028076 [Caranx melampygus]|nr:hypothetical protein INR49_028076 [Caranx melampygus]
MDMEALVGLMLMLLGVSHAPVSSSRLVNDCLSQGELKVSCLSEGGDSPEYSWTLDGRTLTDDKLLSGNKKNNTIILNQDISGLLACSVKNNVSHVSAKKQMSTCAPVSSSRLVNDCLSQGELKVSCLSEGGDSPEYSWTLDGYTLTDDKLLSGNKKNNTIILNQDVSGLLACSVKNMSVMSLLKSRCRPVLWLVHSPLLILLVVGIAVMYAQKKKKSNTNTPAEEAGEQELTYADVRILQRQGKPVKQREEVEVEYGQVKFSEQPRQAVEPAGNDCVYAMVRKDR